MPDNELDTVIAREEAENRRLRTDLAASNARLKILREARRLARGDPPPRETPTIADAAEDVLRRAGKPTHINEILEAVRKQSGFERLAKESLTTALWRLAKAGRRFNNTAPNTFELLK